MFGVGGFGFWVGPDPLGFCCLLLGFRVDGLGFMLRPMPLALS